MNPLVIAIVILHSILIIWGLSIPAHAKCDNRELRPRDKLSATFVGPAAGEDGRHRCKDARVRKAGAAPWPYNEFSAKCNGVTVKGTLHYKPSCAFVDDVIWYVEGTPWKVTGGSHDERKNRDRTTVRLKNGAARAAVKIIRH